MIPLVDPGVPAWLGVLLLLEYVALGFTALYALANTVLILLGFRPARDDVKALAFHDLDLMDDDVNCPPVAILVPAYNEERGIVDSIRTFLELDYPRIEIIICNDGSKDGTLDALRAAFRLQRRDVTSGGRLGTAAVRAVYEAGLPLPERVQRLVVVDKENGGRADALNCALNISRSPYFVTIDADSILDPLALKLIMRVFQDDPSVHASGGQIGIVNEAVLERGRVAAVGVPRDYLPLCQTLEYVRSFTTARTGWTRLGCLMILSGAFLVTRRETALEIGGFLTGRVKSKLLHEYAGEGKGTIGEDMEMIVRLHRYQRELGREARIVHTPLPVCWTEVPSSWKVLSRQRRRWHRGFLEIVRYHRRMILNPAYGRIGLVSFPYLALFELAGPYLEALGYLLLPLLVLRGALDVPRAVLLTAVALGIGVLHSLVSVLCATWLEPIVPARSHMRSLLGMDRWRDRALLLAACVLGELGYRQATVWWRMQGTWEFLRGSGTWGDMERKGFRTQGSGAEGPGAGPSKATAPAAAGIAAAIVVGLAALGAASPAAGAPALREISFLSGVELHDGRAPGTWAESRARWGWTAPAAGRWRAVSAGAFTTDRAGNRDAGFLLGTEAMLGATVGAALELRAAPAADASARWSLHFEGEGALVAPVSGSWVVRYSRFTDLSVVEVAPGTVLYLPGDAWVSVRGTLVRTEFETGPSDDTWGGTIAASLPTGPVEWRALVATGAESYLTGAVPAPRQLRARTTGVSARFPLAPRWRAEIGTFVRFPDRGSDELDAHVGLRRSW